MLCCARAVCWCCLQLLNVLVVAPESLLGLVNGSLRMAHRCVSSTGSQPALHLHSVADWLQQGTCTATSLNACMYASTAAVVL
jgi:hypothetical protein